MQSALRTPSPPWTFRLYLSPSGRSELDKWDRRLSASGKASRDVNMRFLSHQPLERWTRPHASPVGDHVYVIRFHDESRSQHRLIGYFAPEYRSFVICVAALEQDNQYHPADYVDRTIQCRASIGSAFIERTAPCPWPSS